MINHENGRSRPTYFTIKDNDIVWFIPLSSKVDKYKSIIEQKVKRKSLQQEQSCFCLQKNDEIISHHLL